MNTASELSKVWRHVFGEPRFKAQMEWHLGYGLAAQIIEHIEDPEQIVAIALHEEPDWDWWEPTSEWRRNAARNRGAL